MSIQQCQILLDGDQVGQAYVQYLRASEIVVNLIPRHADYRTLHAQHPKLYAQFQKLMMVSSLDQFLVPSAMINANTVFPLVYQPTAVSDGHYKAANHRR